MPKQRSNSRTRSGSRSRSRSPARPRSPSRKARRRLPARKTPKSAAELSALRAKLKEMFLQLKKARNSSK